MEMLNRAIEDAAYSREFLRKLQEPGIGRVRPAVVITPQMRKPLPPKRPGENRRDYRARVLSAHKVEA
ncbi:MAG TPA: hypothetical protein VEB23_08265 [Ramlibacter sp.]|nr:hypothetical protein [Ramlibacter sp.]